MLLTFAGLSHRLLQSTVPSESSVNPLPLVCGAAGSVTQVPAARAGAAIKAMVAMAATAGSGACLMGWSGGGSGVAHRPRRGGYRSSVWPRITELQAVFAAIE